MKKHIIEIGFLALTVILVGCGEKTPKLVQIDGTVLIDGEPCPDVKVTFMPDPEEGNFGRSSVGQTDANGKFTLQYMSEKKWKDGVSVGWHKVSIRDLLPTRERDEDDPEASGQLDRRFDRKYGAAPTTPVRAEITGEGKRSRLK